MARRRPPGACAPFRFVAAAALLVVGAGPRLAHAQPRPVDLLPPVTTLTLAEVVARARDRAPAVRTAFARVLSAEAGVDRARASTLPVVNIQGAGTAFTTNGQVYAAGVVSSSSTETYALGSGTLNLQWTLYDFGRTSSAIDAATAGVSAASLTARATEQVAMGEAAVAFFTLLADDDLVRAAEAVRADREHVVEVTHRLVEGGYRTPVDQTRAQIGLDVAKLDVTLATATRDSDSVVLATALLLDPRTTFHLTAPASIPTDPGAAADPEVALHARRDVAAAAAHIEQARYGVDAAKRARLPSLAVAGLGQLLYAHDVASVTGSGTVTTNGPTALGQVALTLTVPLFDPMTNANIRTADAALAEAQSNLDQVTFAARGDVLQASRQASSARSVLEQSQRLAAGTAANLAAVEDRYATGIDSPLTLADAQREDAVARVAIVRARLSYEVATVRLLAGVSRADELLRIQ